MDEREEEAPRFTPITEMEAKLLILRAELYGAMQKLEGKELDEFWELLEEVQMAGGRKP